MAVPTNYVTKTIKLQPGEPFTVPPGAELIYVSDSNAIETTCIDFPATGTPVCFSFKWAIEFDSGGGSGAWKKQDTTINSLVIGTDIIIPLNLLGDGEFNSFLFVPNDSKLFDELSNSSLFPGEVFEHKSLSATGERREFILSLKLPESLGSSTYLSFTSAGVENARIYAVRCDECCDTNT